MDDSSDTSEVNEYKSQLVPIEFGPDKSPTQDSGDAAETAEEFFQVLNLKGAKR